jgi:hypothetical protein
VIYRTATTTTTTTTEWNDLLRVAIPKSWRKAAHLRVAVAVLDEDGHVACQTLSRTTLQPALSWAEL